MPRCLSVAGQTYQTSRAARRSPSISACWLRPEATALSQVSCKPLDSRCEKQCSFGHLMVLTTCRKVRWCCYSNSQDPLSRRWQRHLKSVLRWHSIAECSYVRERGQNCPWRCDMKHMRQFRSCSWLKTPSKRVGFAVHLHSSTKKLST